MMYHPIREDLLAWRKKSVPLKESMEWIGRTRNQDKRREHHESNPAVRQGARTCFERQLESV